MSDTHSEILERLQAKDALLFGLSDTLDVKASLALVMITFLATQTGAWLSMDGLPIWFHSAQVLAAFVLAAAGIVALVSLWPRNHALEPAEAFEAWVQELRAFYRDAPHPEEAVAQEFRRGRILRLTERIEAHEQLDREKSRLVGLAYVLTGVAVILNLGTVMGLAFITPRLS